MSPIKLTPDSATDNEVIQISSAAADYKKDQALRLENRKRKEEIEALQKQVATLESSLRKRTKVESGDKQASSGEVEIGSKSVSRSDLMSSLAVQEEKNKKLREEIERMKEEVINAQRLKRAMRLQLESCKSHIRKQDGVIASNIDLIKQQRTKIQSYCRKLEGATAEKEQMVRRKNVEIEHLRLQLQMKSFMATAPAVEAVIPDANGVKSGAVAGSGGSGAGAAVGSTKRSDGTVVVEALSGADTMSIARLARKLSQQVGCVVSNLTVPGPTFCPALSFFRST